MAGPTNSSGDAGRTSSSPGTNGSLLWPRLSAEGLKCLAAAAAVLADPGRTVWFPMYGCALLALPIKTPAAEANAAQSAEVAEEEEADIRARLPELLLGLVGLDDWSFRIHK